MEERIYREGEDLRRQQFEDEKKLHRYINALIRIKVPNLESEMANEILEELRIRIRVAAEDADMLSPRLHTAVQDRLKKASDDANRRFLYEPDPAVRRLLFAEFERASNAFMESLKEK